MGKHSKRTKRNSGALDRYLNTPPSDAGQPNQEIPNVKIENPLAEFEAERPISATPPRPQLEPTNQLSIEIPISLDRSVSEITSEDNMPLFCNNCNMQKACPHGRNAVKRVDQKELVVCKKRKDFAGLIQDAGTADRQGLLAYIHKLRQVNAVRIGRMLYKEALGGGGADRNLSLLIDKQVDNTMSEIKLITPQDKGVTNLTFHLTAIHKTVDAYNELPLGIKQHLLQALKGKLLQLRNPAYIDSGTPSAYAEGETSVCTEVAQILPSNDKDNAQGKVAGKQATRESIDDL